MSSEVESFGGVDLVALQPCFCQFQTSSRVKRREGATSRIDISAFLLPHGISSLAHLQESSSITSPTYNLVMEQFLREWRKDALNKNQHEAAIFIGDKLLALTSERDSL
jgi:anaphase-promoting complex subunit 6